MAKKSTPFTINTNMATTSVSDFSNTTVSGSSATPVSWPNVTFSASSVESPSIHDIVHDLKKEIGQLYQRIEILEGAVREETAEKYNAYKRIAELTKK